MLPVAKHTDDQAHTDATHDFLISKRCLVNLAIIFVQ